MIENIYKLDQTKETYVHEERQLEHISIRKKKNYIRGFVKIHFVIKTDQCI